MVGDEDLLCFRYVRIAHYVAIPVYFTSDFTTLAVIVKMTFGRHAFIKGLSGSLVSGANEVHFSANVS